MSADKMTVENTNILKYLAAGWRGCHAFFRSHAKRRWVGLAGLLLAALSFYSLGQLPIPEIKVVNLATEPLFVSSNGDKPTLTLALSVEYPTPGGQYLWDPAVTTTGSSSIDDSYRSGIEYLGYYDAESCYLYNNSPQEKIQSGNVKSDYKRFDRQGPAVAHRCLDAFSGNFLNWVSSSAVDMLRLALSGGDRYIDTENLTILQRAVIPGGDRYCMWNSVLFPAKKLSRADDPSNRFQGAVPQAMVIAAGAKDIWVANMLEKIYFSTDYAGSCWDTSSHQLSTSAGLSTDGFLYGRVSVCNQDRSGILLDRRDYPFCVAYPSGHYKPTGVIQKYGDSMRIAAFGYLLDQSDVRYGGVLRAPMKFVGQNTFDLHGVKNTPEGGNPYAEWDAFNGVFKVNPDGDLSQTPNISGVINYLNKFGRTGVKGRYKVLDPVGELHYEALRYLQGLTPTPAAIKGMTPDMYDGFPVFTRWLDPFGGGRSRSDNFSCMKNSLVVIGDIHTFDTNSVPAADVANNIPDIWGWTDVVRNFELDAASSYVDGQNAVRYTANPNGSNARVPQNQIMGTAYWAHSHDIRGSDWTAQPALQRPGMRVKTLLFDVNNFGWQNEMGYRRYANQFFMAAKYGGYEADPANVAGGPFNLFGNPFLRQDGISDNAVWQKENDPGEARSYFLQSNARGVLSAFEDIFKKTGAQARSIAGTARQSTKTTGPGNVFYQSSFQTGDWSGDIFAVPVNLDNTSREVSVDTTTYWSASRQLLAMPDPALARNIFVGRSGGAAVPNAMPFTWSAVKGSPLADSLDKPDPASRADSLGKDRLMYLRGDRSKEGKPFRVRKKLLGDVISSAVAFVGPPSSPIQNASYANFVNAHKGRTPAVFVGANDGMLHAFNATVSQPGSGKELFAYIPSWMGPKLSALTLPEYQDAHQSYVDGSPTIADAQVGEGGSANEWRTVLISGTGAGGKGLFALDVTDPATFTAGNVMWEFTAADDADIGNVIGRPQILKIRKNEISAKVPVYGWYAVVPGGVNNQLPDSDGNFSRSGQPALFLLDISKAPGTAWAINTNYFKISLPVDSTLSAKTAPGVVNFTAALNSADAVAKIYMGDLHGNIWKLDFSHAKQGSTDWSLAKLSSFNRGVSDITAFPLFTARDASGEVQPITAAPMLVRGSANGVTYVTVGTGKYIEQTDNTNKQVNSVYSIYDTDEAVAADGRAGPQIAGRGRLQEGTAVASTGKVTVSFFHWGHANSDSDTARRSGWYFDFPTDSERQINGGSLFGDTLIFGSLVANDAKAARTCGASGSGYEYQVNVDTGNGISLISRVGILGQPFISELPSLSTDSGTFDNTGQGIRTIHAQSFQQGSLGMAASSQISLNVTVGRLSWRQINNYQELKNAAMP